MGTDEKVKLLVEALELQQKMDKITQEQLKLLKDWIMILTDRITLLEKILTKL